MRRTGCPPRTRRTVSMTGTGGTSSPSAPAVPTALNLSDEVETS